MTVNLSNQATLCAKTIKSTIIALAIAGTLSPFSYNILPANEIFEITLFFSALIISRRITRTAGLAALFFLAYFIYCFSYMKIFSTADSRDFLQAYKAYIHDTTSNILQEENIQQNRTGSSSKNTTRTVHHKI